MCGIAGFLNTSAADRRELHSVAAAMARALTHRGPDDEGIWQDPDVPMALAHRRLSILDLSPEGHQPMRSASGRHMIAFNGEIYNFQELKGNLETAGHVFRGRSDTEVLLEAIDRDGLNLTLQKIGGMFAIALWDRKDRVLHLVRDRLGKKPLYVGWAGSGLVFASELKALRAHPGFEAKINRHALTLYMRYGYVPAPYCIYEGVWQMPPGCRMAVPVNALTSGEDLSARMEPYWHLARAVSDARERTVAGMSDAGAVDALEALLSECVEERMVSDVPLGAFLSGGIDSSAVVALMQRASSRKVKTYTIGFREDGFDEAAHARAVAAHLGTDHHELYVSGADALEIVPRLPDLFDEPFADVSAIPTFLVSRFARQQVTVALSGDGGDEMFGGYDRHTAAPALWNKVRKIPVPIRRWLSAGIRKWPPALWDRINPRHPQFGRKLYRAAEILPLSGPEDIYKRLLSQWDDPESLVIGGRETPVPLWQEDWIPRGVNFAGRMMAGDALSYLPNDILVKVDRASMAAGLEARAPLLDRRIFDFAWALPERFKIRDGQGKWLLRQVLARHVPPALFERPKQGFSMPVGAWLRGPLKDWAEDLLSEERLRREGVFDPAPVRAALAAHQAGQGGHETALWTVLMAQAWLQRWR